MKKLFTAALFLVTTPAWGWDLSLIKDRQGLEIREQGNLGEWGRAAVGLRTLEQEDIRGGGVTITVAPKLVKWRALTLDLPLTVVGLGLETPNPPPAECQDNETFWKLPDVDRQLCESLRKSATKTSPAMALVYQPSVNLQLTVWHLHVGAMATLAKAHRAVWGNLERDKLEGLLIRTYIGFSF
jgi:hypothetical protein